MDDIIGFDEENHIIIEHEDERFRVSLTSGVIEAVGLHEFTKAGIIPKNLTYFILLC
jgi:hypothetical protein